jgi:SP family myo-inositol transporter-like MFS transporter 13
MLYFGRIIIGVGFGIGMMVCNIYLAECSPNKIRGALTTFNSIALSVGILFSYAVGFVTTKW